MSGKRKAAFIDRDGVINEERNYVHRIEDFVLLPGVPDALRLLRDAGYLLVVVTNQAGIARGYYDHAAVDTLHAHLRALLHTEGVVLDGVYLCPHHPAGAVPAFAMDCDCRKPAPGMLLQAAEELGIDLAASILIGDKLSDIEAGRRAGVRATVLVESGHPIPDAERAPGQAVAPDLLAAARLLTGSSSLTPFIAP
jgi:D-glycero-D-manno-heptose 1,7-bisphosphate phosphatase